MHAKQTGTYTLWGVHHHIRQNLHLKHEIEMVVAGEQAAAAASNLPFASQRGWAPETKKGTCLKFHFRVRKRCLIFGLVCWASPALVPPPSQQSSSGNTNKTSSPGPSVPFRGAKGTGCMGPEGWLGGMDTAQHQSPPPKAQTCQRFSRWPGWWWRFGVQTIDEESPGAGAGQKKFPRCSLGAVVGELKGRSGHVMMDFSSHAVVPEPRQYQIAAGEGVEQPDCDIWELMIVRIAFEGHSVWKEGILSNGRGVME